MTFFRKSILALPLMLWIGVGLAEDADVFQSPTAGIQLTKPDGWHFMTAEQRMENIKAMKLSDQELYEELQKNSAPLVAMTKYQEPYDDVNPNFKVKFNPYGELKGKTPLELLNLVVPTFQKTLKDFVLVQPPTEAVVSGLASAYARMHYTMEIPDGRTFPTTSELWIVPRGDYFFIIGAGTRQDEKTGTREEIRAILDTVKIEQR